MHSLQNYFSAGIVQLFVIALGDHYFASESTTSHDSRQPLQNYVHIHMWAETHENYRLCLVISNYG